MAKNKIVRRIRSEKKTPAEVRRLNDIRAKAKQDFPPLEPPCLQPATDGIGAEIRAAREAQGLTWYSLAKKASVPNSTTVRAIEYGRDAKLSNVQAIAAALGLKLELVQQVG